MNPNASSCRSRAFTLVEMLTVIAIIGILAALLMPVLNKSEMRGKRIVCINGLQQIGLAFHGFSNDHNGKFPMALSTNDGGSMEYVESGLDSGPVFYTTYTQFLPLSSELVFPQTLICPSDSRFPATNFPSLQNENLSYFVGVESAFDKPASILAGDRNLATNAFQQPAILGLNPSSHLGWTWEMHQFQGNVLFADGHVEQWNNASLAEGEGASSFDQTLFLPSVPPGENLQFAGSGGSASTPSYQDPEQGTSSSPGNSADQTSASSGASDNSIGNQQPMSVRASSSAQFYKTDVISQVQVIDATNQILPASGVVTDEVVSVQDGGSGMSPVNRQMTAVLQESFLWLYLLLCILVLLYLLNRWRKRAMNRQARQPVD